MCIFNKYPYSPLQCTRHQVKCSGFKPWPRTLCSLASTQVYKWVLANLILGVASIPSRGSRNTPSRFMLQKPEISTGDELMSHLAHTDFYFSLTKATGNSGFKISSGVRVEVGFKQKQDPFEYVFFWKNRFMKIITENLTEYSKSIFYKIINFY